MQRVDEAARARRPCGPRRRAPARPPGRRRPAGGSRRGERPRKMLTSIGSRSSRVTRSSTASCGHQDNHRRQPLRSAVLPTTSALASAPHERDPLDDRVGGRRGHDLHAAAEAPLEQQPGPQGLVVAHDEDQRLPPARWRASRRSALRPACSTGRARSMRAALGRERRVGSRGSPRRSGRGAGSAGLETTVIGAEVLGRELASEADAVAVACEQDDGVGRRGLVHHRPHESATDVLATTMNAIHPPSSTRGQCRSLPSSRPSVWPLTCAADDTRLSRRVPVGHRHRRPPDRGRQLEQRLVALGARARLGVRRAQRRRLRLVAPVARGRRPVPPSSASTATASRSSGAASSPRRASGRPPRSTTTAGIGEALLVAGIDPVVTFHHFTSPRWVAATGRLGRARDRRRGSPAFCERAAARPRLR